MLPLSLSLVGAAAGLWLLVPVVALVGGPRIPRATGGAILGLGAVALLGAALWRAPAEELAFTLPRPLFLGTVALAFRLDALAAWFLGVIAVVSVPTALYLPAYLDHLQDRADLRFFWGALAVLLLSMVLVVLSTNALTFLVAWELMSLSSFLLVATEHRTAATRQAALIYLGATRVGTACLAGAFLWAHALTSSWVFADWHLVGQQALGPGLLLLVGLGVKAGMWPFHLWLPIAHPAAPSPVSALMSGVMVKVAVYMMVRLFLLPASLMHPAFGPTLLTLGAISAFWGVVFALLQHDLKRLLAYHTVENIGLILMGVGGALVARDLGLATVARLGLAAALFHVLNHALFKSLLFLSAGAVDMAVGTRDLERLGGLGQSMRGTFACFLVGSAAICALPPLNGFASEWLLYQSVLGLAARGAPPLLRFLALLLLGWIAGIGALALACFVKATGVAFLGRPRSRRAARAHEVPRGMLLAQATFGVGCVGVGLLAPAVLTLLHPIVAPLDPGGAPLASAWTLPTAALVLVLSATAALLALGLGSLARWQPVRWGRTWECGFGALTPRMQVTATSFAQPIARLFGGLFRYAIQLHIDGANRRLFPEEIRVHPRTEALLESRIYGPLLRGVNRLGDWVVHLQAGSIHLYLLTMFGTLVLLLALGGYAR